MQFGYQNFQTHHKADKLEQRMNEELMFFIVSHTCIAQFVCFGIFDAALPTT